MEKPLYTMQRTVKFQEVDAAGIIFFARFFEYFHDTFMNYLQDKGVSLAQNFKKHTWGMPLAHAEADFKKPLFFEDKIHIEISKITRGSTSITFEFRVTDSENTEKVFCTGKTVHVFTDLASFRSIPIPEEMA